MPAWAKVLIEAVLAVVKVIPILDRWFTRPTTPKVDSARADVREEIDHFKETGRPK